MLGVVNQDIATELDFTARLVDALTDLQRLMRSRPREVVDQGAKAG